MLAYSKLYQFFRKKWNSYFFDPTVQMSCINCDNLFWGKKFDMIKIYFFIVVCYISILIFIQSLKSEGTFVS